MYFKRFSIILTLFLFTFNLNGQCWNLVWEDDFSGSSLNTSNWSHQIGAGGWGNNELQYYTNNSNNIAVTGGNLEITAQEESYNGSNYTSSRIRTINKADFTYGKMEARIQLPEGQGIWPAFWMMPTDAEYGGWPASGEMDIMEYLGHQTNIAYGTCHYGYVGDHQFSGSSYTLPTGNFTDDFYTFSMEWEPDTIKWFVNDIHYFTIKRSDLGSYPWVFDKDFHFILNVAVGGNWPGAPDNSTVFPQTMKVDYVRVYQSLPDVQIVGKETLLPGETALTYSAPNITSASYSWTVPSDATIVSGQGTSEIVVDFGSASGDITCQLTTACGSTTSTLPLVITNNYFGNPDFELDYQSWSSNIFNGAAASFSILTNNPQQGLKSAQIDVTNGANNAWDVQLSHSNFSLENGITYNLKFWAKAENNDVQIPFAIIKNQSPWTIYSISTITLSDTWTEYTHSFTSNVDDDVLFNLDLGGQNELYYFDNFYFSKAVSACPSDWTIDSNPLDQDVISVTNTLATYGNIVVQSGDEVVFQAEQSITLLPGFQAYSGSDFKAYLTSCNPSSLIVDENDTVYNIQNTEKEENPIYQEKPNIEIYPNPTDGLIYLKGINREISITIFDGFNKVVHHKKDFQNSTIDLSSLPSGVYSIILKMEKVIIAKRVVKL